MKSLIFLFCFLVLSACKVSYEDSVADVNPSNNSSLGIYFKGKICLEGAYLGSGTLMAPTLSTVSLLPNVLGSNWVDSVTVELFKLEGAIYQLIDSQSALVDQDGDLYSSELNQGVFFPFLQSGEYYINIKTRNHLSVGALNPVTLSTVLNTSYDIDFTDQNVDYLSEVSTPYTIKGSAKCLAAGDINQDNIINSTDRTLIHTFLNATLTNFNPNTIVAGYFKEDVDLSGGVQEYVDGLGLNESGTDSELITTNLAKSSQVYPIP